MADGLLPFLLGPAARQAAADTATSGYDPAYQAQVDALLAKRKADTQALRDQAAQNDQLYGQMNRDIGALKLTPNLPRAPTTIGGYPVDQVGSMGPAPDQTPQVPDDLAEYQQRKAAMAAPAAKTDVPDDLANYQKFREKQITGKAAAPPAPKADTSDDAPSPSGGDIFRTPSDDLIDQAYPASADQRRRAREAGAQVPMPAGDQHPADPVQAQAGAIADMLTLGNADRYLAMPAGIASGGKDYNAARSYYREALNENRQKLPLNSAAGDLMGSFIGPEGLATKAGMDLMRPVVASAAKISPMLGFAAKTATASGIGAADAAMYGAGPLAEQQARARGEDSPDLATRAAVARQTAPTGAILGGAAPSLEVAARPVVRAVGGKVAQLSDLATNTGAAFFPDLIKPGTAVAQHNATVADAAVSRELARNGIVTVDDFMQRAAKYGDKPVMTGELTQGTLNNLVALTRGKGTTAEKANAILEDRVAGMPGRMLKDLSDETGLAPEAIVGHIEGMMAAGRMKAAPIYDQAFQAGQNIMSPRLVELMDNPRLQPYLKDAQATKQSLEITDKRKIGDAEYFDLVKRAIDDKEQTLLQKGEVIPRDMEAMRSTLVKELDRLVPGYAKARLAGSEAPQIEEAFGKGQQAMTARPMADDVEAEVSRLSGTPLTAYQSGVVRSIVKGVENKTLTPNRIKAPAFQSKLRSVFGDEAADGIIRKFGLEAELAQKGSRINPNVGSVTSQALLGAPSQAGDEAVKAAANLATGNKVGLAMQAISALRRQGYSEDQLNSIGDLLLARPNEAAGRLFPGQRPGPGSIPPPPGPAGQVRDNPAPQPPKQVPGSANFGAPIHDPMHDIANDLAPDAAGAGASGLMGYVTTPDGEDPTKRAATFAALGGLGTRAARFTAGKMAIDPTSLGAFGANARAAKPVDDATMTAASNKLSDSEFEAWKAAREGMTNDQIADRLGSRGKTVLGAGGKQISVTSDQEVPSTDYVRALLSRARAKGFDTDSGPVGRPPILANAVSDLMRKGLSTASIIERLGSENAGSIKSTMTRVRRDMEANGEPVAPRYSRDNIETPPPAAAPPADLEDNVRSLLGEGRTTAEIVSRLGGEDANPVIAMVGKLRKQLADAPPEAGATSGGLIDNPTPRAEALPDWLQTSRWHDLNADSPAHPDAVAANIDRGKADFPDLPPLQAGARHVIERLQGQGASYVTDKTVGHALGLNPYEVAPALTALRKSGFNWESAPAPKGGGPELNSPAGVAGGVLGALHGGFEDDKGDWSLENPVNAKQALAEGVLGALGGHVAGKMAAKADLNPTKMGAFGGNAVGEPDPRISDLAKTLDENMTQHSLEQMQNARLAAGKIPPVMKLFKDSSGRVFGWASDAHPEGFSHDEARDILGLGDTPLQHGQVRYGQKLGDVDWYGKSGQEGRGMQDYTYRRKLATEGVTRDPGFGSSTWETPTGHEAQIRIGDAGAGPNGPANAYFTIDGKMRKPDVGGMEGTANHSATIKKAFSVLERDAIQSDRAVITFTGATDANNRLYRSALERFGAPRGYVGIVAPDGKAFALVREDHFNSLSKAGKISQDVGVIRNRSGLGPVPGFQRDTGLFGVPAALAGGTLAALAGGHENAAH